MNALSNVVYNHLFPGGMIPLACKNNLAAIDARITEIEVLASGRSFDGSKRAASRLITEQIVQLRESTTPPMPYMEIARRLGGRMTLDAVRNRYEVHKAAQKAEAVQQEGYAAISGQAIQAGRYTTHLEVQERIDGSEHISAATKMIGQEDHFVEPDKMVHGNSPEAQEIRRIMQRDGLSPVAAARKAIGPVQWDGPDTEDGEGGATNQPQNSHIVADYNEKDKYDRYIVPIPKDVEEEIFRLYNGGLSVRQVADALTKRGIQISWRRVRGQISNAAKRDRAKSYEGARKKEAESSMAWGEERIPTPQNVAPRQPQATPDPSHPGVEGVQEAARANPRGTPEEARPVPKSITRADLNIRIWDAWQEGDSIKKISEDLNSEGYYYDERQVRNRLKQQGAEL